MYRPMCYLQETYMKQNNTKRLKVKANPNPKKVIMATLMSDTLVFKAERNT